MSDHQNFEEGTTGLAGLPSRAGVGGGGRSSVGPVMRRQRSVGVGGGASCAASHPIIESRTPPRRRFLAAKSPDVVVKIRQALQEVEPSQQGETASEPYINRRFKEVPIKRSAGRRIIGPQKPPQPLPTVTEVASDPDAAEESTTEVTAVESSTSASRTLGDPT